MSTPSFQTGRRKIAPPFGGFTPAWGGEIYTGLFFVYSPVIFEVALASCGQRKEGIIFALIHSYLAWETALTPTCVKSPENRHDPYRDTVENGSTLGNFGIHDPQLDPKALKSTPNF